MVDSKRSRHSHRASNPTKPNDADLECPGILDYLRRKPTQSLIQLYNYPSICLALYRELPDVAKQFIMRTLFVQQPVPQAVIASWISKQYANELREATTCLTELGIWSVTVIPGGLIAWEICLAFKRNLKLCLMGGGRRWNMHAASGKHAKKRDHALLDQYAMSRWRCVLQYMVSLGAQTRFGADSEVVSPDAVRLLLHANLMRREENGLSITRKGFQFLLLDTQSQVWFLMLQYLDTCDGLELSFDDCLSMLYKLSFMTLGFAYSSNGIAPKTLIYLQHLREFGLVYQRKRKDGCFYPTRLAVNLTHKNAAMPSIDTDTKQKKDDTDGFIIIETNYRVYAYTDSILQIAILGLFTELIYRFPNLVIGIMTRDSVRQAFRGGITSDQIISYLEQHVHPKTQERDSSHSHKSILPPPIVDQIKLWEAERKRFVYEDGFVYNQFLSLTDYVTLRNYAESTVSLIWQNERTRTMVVSRKGHDDVKKYWKKYSKSGV